MATTKQLELALKRTITKIQKTTVELSALKEEKVKLKAEIKEAKAAEKTNPSPKTKKTTTKKKTTKAVRKKSTKTARKKSTK